MESAPLRGAQGGLCPPYARSNALAASRLALAGYPLGDFGNNFQRTAKVATRSAHDKLEHVAASATAETFEAPFFRRNVKRRIAFFVQWAEAD
jgi:hypothetical protein